MDKDNLDIHSMLSNLSREALETARAETRQQLVSALCLTAVGLFLALLGLLGLTLKLGSLAKFSVLFATRPFMFLIFHKKRIQKLL